MKMVILYKDKTIENYDDIDCFAMSDYTLELKHYNGTSRCISRSFIKNMGVLNNENK